jgi:hypothetical protein
MGGDHVTVSRELQEDLLKESAFIEDPVCGVGYCCL